MFDYSASLAGHSQSLDLKSSSKIAREPSAKSKLWYATCLLAGCRLRVYDYTEHSTMEFRQLGGSGFKVPVLSLGTGTFGSKNERISAFGTTQVEEATRLVDVCFEAGLNMFDSADIYSDGSSEEVLGKAIKGRRDQVIISTRPPSGQGQGTTTWVLPGTI